MKKLLGSRSVIGLVFLPALAATGLANADDQRFEAALSGAQEAVFDESQVFIPGGTDTDATGRIDVRFDKAFTKLWVDLRVNGLTGTFSAAHFHCGRPGQNGPVVFGMANPGMLVFDGRRIRGTLTNADFANADCLEVVGRGINNIAALAFAMRDGLVYANVHTDLFSSGEIRGQMLASDDGDHDD